MSGTALWNGLKAYLGSLVATVLFPLLWLQSLRLARQHADADPRGRLKVLVAIGASLALGAVGSYALLSLQANAQTGIYDSLDARMAGLLGEGEYQTNSEIVLNKPATLQVIQQKIDEGQAQGQNTSALEQALADGQKELADATARMQELTPNHALYLQVAVAVQDQDDARVRALVDGAGLSDPKNIGPNMDAAFAIKDESVKDMRAWMLIFLWPSVAGAFFAPLAFALGSILKAAFVPSDSVGFKPYPGAAAGWFLLLGAFGLPSIPFAAWTFLDAKQRSEEGQIAL